MSKELEKKSTLNLSIGVDEAENLESIEEFNQYVEESKVIPNTAKICLETDQETVHKQYDIERLLGNFFIKKGPELISLKLRLRILKDLEDLAGYWIHLTKLRTLHIEYFKFREMRFFERTSRRMFENCQKNLYLHSLRELYFPVHALEFRPMKQFLYQADMKNLEFIGISDSPPQARFLFTDTHLLRLRHCTGLKFELKGYDVNQRCVKSLDQGYDVFVPSSGEEQDDDTEDDQEEEEEEDEGEEEEEED